MAIKVANTVVINDTRDITFTTNQCTTRGLAGNVQISTTASLTGSGYSVCGNKALTLTGKGFSNTVFDNSACLIVLDPLTPQQGTISGYMSGGTFPITDAIDKFPFATDTNATDVGELTQVRQHVAGQSSSISGYSTGGDTGSGVSNTIDKFPFSSDTNATDVGDLTQSTNAATGQSSSVSGYTSGGVTPSVSNTIDKFPFSSDTNASDVGELTCARERAAGQSSRESGYSSGGNSQLNTIDKFPFAADDNASDVGDLSQGRSAAGGQSSTISGYTSGGAITNPPAPFVNTIDKFPFSTDANSSDVGDLTQGRYRVAGQSSADFGYSTGGGNPGVDIIDKFPFSTDVNASDVGNLTGSRRSGAGQQSGGNA